MALPPAAGDFFKLMSLDEQIGVDSAKSKCVRPLLMALEQQHDELMERIRDFRAEVDALVGPISPEQAVELRKRYQELCAERNLLQKLHELQPN